MWLQHAPWIYFMCYLGVMSSEISQCSTHSSRTSIHIAGVELYSAVCMHGWTSSYQPCMCNSVVRLMHNAITTCTVGDDDDDNDGPAQHNR